jgi:hypothetical protein
MPVLVPKRRPKSSELQDTPQTARQASHANPLAKLYRVAATDQLARLEEDPALDSQEKLAALYEVFESVVGTINRLSSPAPSEAPELWAEKGARNNTAEDINSFIVRVYGTYKQRGMNMGHLLHLDPQAHRAWYDWRKLPKNKGKLPPLATRRQAADQAIAEAGGAVSLAGLAERLPEALRASLRLKGTISMRRHRAKSSGGPN